jgi:hypothetical protein
MELLAVPEQKHIIAVARFRNCIGIEGNEAPALIGLWGTALSCSEGLLLLPSPTACAKAVG